MTLMQTTLFHQAPAVPTSKGQKDNSDCIAQASDNDPRAELQEAGSFRIMSFEEAEWRELIKVAGQISKLDAMLEQAQASPPAKNDAEAQQWHSVSVTALAWSRAELARQQKNLLLQLRSSLLAVPALPEVAKDTAYVEQKHTCTEVAKDTAHVEQKHTCSEGMVIDQTPEDVGALPPGSVGSLRVDLERLREYNPDCCLIVRKIKTLGLESAQKMESHFEAIGEVAEVLVAHSYERPSPKRRNGRVRPAALGFVVMATKEGCDRVIELGEHHSIGDIVVSVQKFEPFGEGKALVAQMTGL